MHPPSSKVYITDSRDLGEIEDGSVHLMVTSPPYWHIKDYGREDQVGHGQSLHEYLKDLYRLWEEVYRVLAPGRRACINIGDQFTRASVYGRYKVVPIHAEIILQMERIGFDFMGSIIWTKRTTMKTTGGANIMGSYPYPPNGIVQIDYENILIFKKPGKIPKFDPEIKQRSKLTKEEWKEYYLSHWNFGGARQVGHEAMFPEELPKRLVKMFSLEGEIVLDPFLGSGTTALAANRLGRDCIGYEINPDFIPLIEGKLQELDGNLEVVEDLKETLIEDMDYEPLVQNIDPVEPLDDEPDETYKVTGLTVDLGLEIDDGRTIHFLGVDITDVQGARQYLDKYIVGKRVILKGVNGNIAYVYLANRIFINKELVKGGWALVDKVIDHPMKERLVRLEK